MATALMVKDSDTFAQEALTMALAIIMDRIRHVSPDDRKDLFELAMALPNAETKEEIDGIWVTMHEILQQAPVRIVRIDLNDDPPKSAGKWVAYVSEKIKTARKEAGLTQEELAEKSGLPQSHISRLESGVHSPSRMTLEKIAAALDKEPKFFDPLA